MSDFNKRVTSLNPKAKEDFLKSEENLPTKVVKAGQEKIIEVMSKDKTELVVKRHVLFGSKGKVWVDAFHDGEIAVFRRQSDNQIIDGMKMTSTRFNTLADSKHFFNKN